MKAVWILAHGQLTNPEDGTTGVFFVYGSGSSGESITLSEIGDPDDSHWLGWLPNGQLDEVILHSCYLGRSSGFVNLVFRSPRFHHAHSWWDHTFRALNWEVFLHWPKRVGPPLPDQQVDSLICGCQGDTCEDFCPIPERDCAGVDSGSCSQPQDPGFTCALEYLEAGAALLCEDDQAGAKERLADALDCLLQIPAENRDEAINDLVAEIRQILGGGIPAVSEWGLVGLTVVLLTAGTIVLRRRRAMG